MSAPKAPAPRGGLAGWQVRTLTQLGPDRIARLNVRQMAAAARLSPHHFSRAFRISFGCAPRTWLVARKMAQAQDRLTSTDDPVDRIAVDLGYRSGSQLARAFRAHAGCSPRAFRRA